MTRSARLAVGATCALFAAFAGTGCVSQARYDAALSDLQGARRDNAAMYWQSVALQREVELRDAKLKEVATAEEYVRKLQEITALNTDVSRRLLNAQKALEEVSKKKDKRSELSPLARTTLDNLSAERQEAEARDEAYERLVRNVQALVDSGRIKLTTHEGRLRFWLPRPIDYDDPWPAAQRTTK